MEIEMRTEGAVRDGLLAMTAFWLSVLFNPGHRRQVTAAARRRTLLAAIILNGCQGAYHVALPHLHNEE
jgi:hypothetical protein